MNQLIATTPYCASAKRTRLALVLLLALLLCACAEQNGKISDTERSIVPRSIVVLMEQSQLPVTWDVSINGALVSSALPALSNDNQLMIDEQLLSRPANQIDVAFYLDQPLPGDRLPLASASVVVPQKSSGEVAVISGLEFTYTDTDDDGIHDVHELAVSPVDLDNDNLTNERDIDSDGDSLDDGEDPEPYSGADGGAPQTGFQTFLLNSQNGTSQDIRVINTTGSTEALLHLVNTLGEVTLRSSFVFSTSDSLVANGYWHAFGLSSGSGATCPEWRITRDTSAIRSTLSRSALLFFDRFDSSPFMAKLGSGTISDLDIIDNSLGVVGRGVWNDALRMILVPAGTVGWIELNTDTGFTGVSCVLNLSSPAFESEL